MLSESDLVGDEVGVEQRLDERTPPLFGRRQCLAARPQVNAAGFLRRFGQQRGQPARRSAPVLVWLLAPVQGGVGISGHLFVTYTHGGAPNISSRSAIGRPDKWRDRESEVETLVRVNPKSLSQPGTALLAFASIATLLFSACETTPEPDRVMGRVEGPGVPMTTAELITAPGPGGTIRLSTDVGRGRRAVTLSPVEALQLIAVLQKYLAEWDDWSDKRPFRETLMMGVASAGTAAPFFVQLAKSPGMEDPVFIVVVGYAEAIGGLALDRKNAKRWVTHLQRARTI
jgi:hypothetical protein